jgi:hypothetical protein
MGKASRPSGRLASGASSGVLQTASEEHAAKASAVGVGHVTPSWELRGNRLINCCLTSSALKPTPATDRSQLPAIGGRKNVNRLQPLPH